MDKREFVNQLEKIEIAYKKKFSKDEYVMWFEEFKTTDIKQFANAIDRVIQESKFVPKIADIRAKIAVNPSDYYIKDPYFHLYKNKEWCEIEED